MSVYKKVHQCLNAITFKFVNNACPYYLNEVYEDAPRCRIESRCNFPKLRISFWKTNMGQKGLSYIGTSLWNNLPKCVKKRTVLNAFKHNMIIIGIYLSSVPIYIFICLFIYLFVLFIYWFIYLFAYLFLFSLAYLVVFFDFYFAYSPVPLPCLTIYFILLIMYPFRYLIMFLTCSSLWLQYHCLFNIFVLTSEINCFLNS